jgi:hypothetical protein
MILLYGICIYYISQQNRIIFALPSADPAAWR